MRKLLKAVKAVQGSEIKKVIDDRIRGFKSLGGKNIDDIFSELCFCLLTANFNAERGIKIQKEIGKGFHDLSERGLVKKLKALGHRFPNMRAKFIYEARKHKTALGKLIKNRAPDRELRQWLEKNVKGLGYKESSHFLRNIGRDNCAIIDFHIVDILRYHKLIEPVKTMSKKIYLHIESVLSKLAKKLGITLAELDLYLWYLETGKILK
ncbi:MAG: N-glycosylase/DNA lyase [Candidatus Margulisiibacteriota bacterium]